MAEIIKFPNSKKSPTVKAAEELEIKKQTVENTLNLAMLSPVWESYVITSDDIECVAHFGEYMKLDVLAATRLASRLATNNKKLIQILKENFSDDPYGYE